MANPSQIVHDDVLNHPNLDIRKVNLEQLLWLVLQSTWPNIRLQALLAFMRKITIQDPATEARLWQHFHEIGMTFQPWQNSNSRPTPALLNTMTAINHHFKDHLSAMRFLDANMATATKIGSMTLDCTHSSSGSSSNIVKPISSVLQYLSWINDKSDVPFIAHLQNPSNKDEWISTVVRLRGCFQGSKASAHRQLIVGTVPLHIISLQDTLDARGWLPNQPYLFIPDYFGNNPDKANTIQVLQSKIDAYFTPASGLDRTMLPTNWPPKHIEWNVNLQDEENNHLDVLQFFICAVETPSFWELAEQSLREYS